MVPRILKTLNRSVSGLHEAAYLLAIFAFFSQILALFRDRLLAHFFGASVTLDVYYAAFRIPDFIFASVASVVSLFILVPFLAERLPDIKKAQEFVNTIFSGFFVTIVTVSIVAFFLVPQIVSILFPGFEGEALSDLVLFTRILLLSPIILGISNVLASITQAHKQFVVYAVAPLLYNIGIIVGILVLLPMFGTEGLVMGVVLGALLHILVQVPAVVKDKLAPRFVLRARFATFMQVVYTALPRTFTLAINQLVLLILIAIASTMNEGSISVFNFAFNLNGVPLALIGASYSVAAFPTLAKLFTGGEHERFFKQMEVAMRHILFWALPVTILFIVLRAHIVRVVLGSGAFDWADTRLTAAVLALFVVSLVAHALHLLFVRGYYAAGRTKRPLVVNSISALFIIILSYFGVWLFESSLSVQHFFESLLRVENIVGTQVLMLAVAYSLGMILNVIIFLFMFNHDFGHRFSRSLANTFFHSFAGGVVGGAAAYGLLVFLGPLFGLDTFWGVFGQGIISGVVGIIVATIMLKILKSEELEEVWSAIHKKFWKRTPIAPEPEEI